MFGIDLNSAKVMPSLRNVHKVARNRNSHRCIPSDPHSLDYGVRAPPIIAEQHGRVGTDKGRKAAVRCYTVYREVILMGPTVACVVRVPMHDNYYFPGSAGGGYLC